ncbi:MAG TPA: hypothetical protein GX396_05005 [Tissierellia bacterium]|jgi:predicted peptidase|nr:hypothetical protein [Tissierellia bacterium]
MSIENNIKITEKAIMHLKKKGKTQIVIEYPEYRTNCDCVFVPVPEIFARKPKKPEDYLIATIDGIDVYISKAVEIPEKGIVIDVESFLGLKLLRMTGFKIRER